MHQKFSEVLDRERNTPTHPVQAQDNVQICLTASETGQTRWKALRCAKHAKDANAAIDAQENVSIRPTEPILPHIPIGKVDICGSVHSLKTASIW